MIPRTNEAYRLLHDGALAFAEIESNGIRIDTKYLDKAIKKMKRRIKRLESNLHETDVMKAWRKTYRKDLNTQSTKQLGHILYDVMGFNCPAQTEKGGNKTDEKTLSTIDHPFIKKYMKVKKYKKALNTYLRGLKREVVDGYMRPFFNLHRVSTYRSSSNAVNFQNQPVRDPEIMKIVRQAYIARKGRRIYETDYGGIEVAVAACYHKDPNMLSYINDETKDMHRDMAMECFMLKKKQVNKIVRYCGKNMFVFPQFYGDYYIDCARNLWEAIRQLDLKTVKGMSLAKHLLKKGIKGLGDLNPKESPRPHTFEKHIQEIEHHFWNERFKVYGQWKRDWYDEYKIKGWLETLTGFICQGYMKRNEAISYPIQGSAFHCLLWSVIKIMKEIKKRKMKTLVIGQIHDSIVSDVPDEESDEYEALVYEIMVEELQRQWEWIIIPLKIETERTPLNGNWSQKKEIAA